MDVLPQRQHLDNVASVAVSPASTDALAMHDAALAESRDLLARTCGLGEAHGQACTGTQLRAVVLACGLVYSEIEAMATSQLVRAARLAAVRGRHALVADLERVARRDAGLARVLVDDATSHLRHEPRLARAEGRVVSVAVGMRSSVDRLADDALVAGSLVSLVTLRREHALAWARIAGRLAPACAGLGIEWPAGACLESAALEESRALDAPLRALLAGATPDGVIEARVAAKQAHRLIASAVRHACEAVVSTDRSGTTATGR